MDQIRLDSCWPNEKTRRRCEKNPHPLALTFVFKKKKIQNSREEKRNEKKNPSGNGKSSSKRSLLKWKKVFDVFVNFVFLRRPRRLRLSTQIGCPCPVDVFNVEGDEVVVENSASKFCSSLSWNFFHFHFYYFWEHEKLFLCVREKWMVSFDWERMREFFGGGFFGGWGLTWRVEWAICCLCWTFFNFGLFSRSLSSPHVDSRSFTLSKKYFSLLTHVLGIDELMKVKWGKN